MILVTGADGIVGRAVCNALRLANQAILPVVRRKQDVTMKNAYIIDLAQSDALSILAHSRVSAIVHLAAAVPHSANYPDTELSADLTRRIDMNVYSFQERLDIPALYMSTCGLYDRSLDVVKYEDDASVIKIESPYFSAKLAGESLFKGNQRSTILRLSAPVGPGLKPSVVLSRFIMSARANVPIQIWGSGSREQNFIDVRDVSALIIKVLANPQACTINVASDTPITMANLANTVIKVVGKGRAEYSSRADPRDGETARYSIAKAQEIFGWSPKYDIEASCRLLLNERFENN